MGQSYSALGMVLVKDTALVLGGFYLEFQSSYVKKFFVLFLGKQDSKKEAIPTDLPLRDFPGCCPVRVVQGCGYS